MEIIKKLEKDKMYSISLKTYEGYIEYCLVNRNDNNEIFQILEEKEII